MRNLLLLAAAAACVGFGASFDDPEAQPISAMVAKSDVVEHGGGCRKSSPPGQCCHMERRTGVVHCH